MTDTLTQVIKPFLASDYALLIVGTIIALVIYLYLEEKKLQDKIRTNYQRRTSEKFAELKQSTDKIEPLLIQIAKLETKLDEQIQSMNDHKTAMGNASKAIAGEFIDLSKSTNESISSIKSAAEQVKFDFVSSQNEMRIIAEKLEYIFKELEKRYGRVMKIQDKVDDGFGRIIKLEERDCWTKQAIEENRDALVKTKSILKNFKERLDSKK